MYTKMRNTTYIIILIFITILSNSFLLTATAGECEYGSFYAWFRKDDGEWQNATAHPTLKLGEEFEVKATITAKEDILVTTIQLYEFGTPVFEVLDGPSNVGEYLDCGHNLKTNDSFSYTWTLRVKPNTTWMEGYAPLEVFSQFSKDHDHNCKISFDVIAAYIVDELWGGYVDDGNNGDDQVENNVDSTPGFEIILAMVAIALFLFWRKSRTR